jgi:hypothetical protein
MDAEKLGRATGFIMIIIVVVLFIWKFLDKKKK